MNIYRLKRIDDFQLLDEYKAFIIRAKNEESAKEIALKTIKQSEYDPYKYSHLCEFSIELIEDSSKEEVIYGDVWYS
ncbi:hypothetical protein [Priestia megaterium]|uniref:hypothetical protein n=1 Tax=Priestia megaterium TaxID=1404 RepID=UPI003CC580E7